MLLDCWILGLDFQPLPPLIAGFIRWNFVFRTLTLLIFGGRSGLRSFLDLFAGFLITGIMSAGAFCRIYAPMIADPFICMHSYMIFGTNVIGCIGYV